MTDFEAVDAKALSNLILDWADADQIQLSPMKLQKLVFFSHADFLAKFDRPLIKQDFEAWDYGPVIPSLYKEFKRFQSEPITARAKLFNPFTLIESEPCAVLPLFILGEVRTLYDFYKRLSAGTLSDISHSYEGAWRQARSLFANGLNMDRRMSNELIKRFHRTMHT